MTPKTAREWRSEGDGHYDARRWNEAARAFESALALEPGSTDAWYRLGNARQELGDDERAAQCFEQVVARDPSNARAWNNLGVSRQKLGQERTAAAAYRRALEQDPDLRQATLNLAHLLAGFGDDEAAVGLLAQAVEIDPDDTDAWQALALAQLRLGREADANRSYQTAMHKLLPVVQPMLDEAEAARVRGDNAESERLMVAALKYMPHNPLLRHMIAAMRGETLPRASKGYVTALFDDFARNYDQLMRVNLQYRAPESLAKAVLPLLKPSARVIDLGCGTGFLGAALAHTRAHLTGIDLSAKMLEQAGRRNAYARLVQGDLVEELDAMERASCDAILAADVFIYFGDLRPVFAAAVRVLAPGGIFAFTTEALDDARDFELRTSGRYAHSSRYLGELARQARLVEHSLERIPGRREGGNTLEFWLACLRAP